MCLNSKGLITSLDRCSSILVVDVDEKKVVDKISVNGVHDPEVLGDYFDKYDPHVFFTCGANEELLVGVEEYGVHVYIVRSVNYNDLLDEFYGFRV